MRRKSFVKNHISNNSVKYIFSLLFFAVGIIIGSFFMAKMDIEKEKKLVEYFVSAATDTHQGFTEIFANCLITHFKYILTYFILSLSFITSRLCPAVCGVKGFATGFTCAFLIKNYSGAGITYVLLSILPSAAITFPVYAFASVVCMNFASGRRKRGDVGARTVLPVLPAMLIIYTLMAASSLYDGVITPFVFRQLF